jgi:hypothetical protein
MPKGLTTAVAALLLLTCWGTGMAQTPATQPADDDVKTTIQALQARIKDQEKRLSELESKNTDVAAKQARYEETKAIMKEIMDKDGGKTGLPSWLDNLKFAGDLRLRYQYDKQGDKHVEGVDQGVAPKDRNRYRYRLRFGFTKAWLDDQMEIGFRLASGENDDPTSTNQTFTGDFDKKLIWIDQVWAKYTPKDLKGLTLIAGKMPNPFVNTDMIWDPDVNPEGVWAKYTVPNLGMFAPFAGAGYFTLMEVADDHRANLYAYQVGNVTTFTKDVKYTIALAEYTYDHYWDNFARADGNNIADDKGLDARGFAVFDVINKVDWNLFNLPMSATFDMARNCGDTADTLGYRNQNDAYAAYFKVGQNVKKGDWSVLYKYAYIEANAVVGAFADSDFGFANRKGSQLGVAYNITDWLTAGVNVYYTDPVTGPAQDTKLLTIMADIVWKF